MSDSQGNSRTVERPKWTSALLDSLALPTEARAGDMIPPDWEQNIEATPGRLLAWSGNIYSYTIGGPPKPPPPPKPSIRRQ